MPMNSVVSQCGLLQKMLMAVFGEELSTISSSPIKVKKTLKVFGIDQMSPSKRQVQSEHSCLVSIIDFGFFLKRKPGG